MVFRACGDQAGYAAAMDTVTGYGDAAMYTACVGWSEVVNRLVFDRHDPEPGFWGMDLVDEDGTEIDPDTLPERERPRMWAARFMIAHANGDKDTCDALFEVARADPERLGYGVFHLVDFAAGAIHAAHAEKKRAARPAGRRPARRAKRKRPRGR